MPLQNTFTLVPKTLGPAAQSPSALRPMTSKQVRTAYKAANRAPPMSKAERIKQERAEQERIRKEFDKEKTAARARVARERKREKETAEKEQKKKNGLPLVSVRPSQDTIAWFVRGNGSGKKRDCVGQHVADMKAEVAPAPPLRIEEEQKEQDNDRSDKNKPMVPTEDDFELEMLQDLDMIFEDDGNCDETTSVDEERLPDFRPQTKDSEPKIFQEPDLIPEEDDLEMEMLAMDAIAIPEQSSEESRELGPVQDDGQKPTRRATSYETDLGLNSKSPREAATRDSHPTKPPDREPLMPPPPPPPPPRRRSPSPISPITPRAQPPPPSTQAILCNFDDFFPTSSQQARELEEETEASTPNPIEPDLALKAEEARPPAPEPSPPSFPPSSGSPEPQKRFFTSSGSNEAFLLAKRRSCRTFFQEETQRKEMMRLEAGELLKMKEAEEARKAREVGLARSKETVKTSSPTSQPGNKAVGTKPASSIGARKIPPIQARKTPPMETNFRTSHPVEAKKTPSTGTHINKPPPSVETKKKPTMPPIDIVTKKPPEKEANKENIPPAEQHGASFPSASQETEYGGDWIDEATMELDYDLM